MKVVIVFLVAAVISPYASACMHVLRHKSNGRNFIRRIISSASDGPDNENITHKDLDSFLTDHFNASPTNPWTQKFWETKVSDVTYNFVRDHETRVILTVIPIYENVRAVRPESFVVLVEPDRSKIICGTLKAYIPNPSTKTVLRTISPYVYSVSNLSLTTPVDATLFMYGVEKRVEMGMKVISRSRLASGTDLDESSKNWSKHLARNDPRYLPGLLISQKLGGRGTDTFNVVPMTSEALKVFEDLVVTPTLDFFEDPKNRGEETVLTVIVMYANNVTTCPVGFVVLRSDTHNQAADSLYIPNQ
ncbi:hypothetical protein GE061_010566 [Apolygus lucorum]|uniref:Uncharacterized protein n=1 Tax=Apolygus lucorum TaxID=248454 RepID=A0A6A4K5Z4_APOLU|nr:hypothetical protein GE061_010566 [Apolygus lucorum]